MNYSEIRKNYIKKITMIDKVILFLFGAYFFLTPFYLWRSGLPQVADIVLIISVLLFLAKNHSSFVISEKDKVFITIGGIFVFWVLINNFTWILILNITDGFIINSMFYMYNYFILVSSVMMMREYKNILYRYIFNVTVLVLIMQLFIYIVSGGYSGGRNLGTFNNPNQLGYFSLIATGVLMYLSDYFSNKNLMLIIGLLSSAILVLSSLSNAAVISWLIMFFLFLLSKTENKKAKRRIILITIAISFAVLWVYINTNIIQNNGLYQALELRLGGTQDKIGDSFDIRGYYRITDYPKYWLFGSGEGAYHRFNSYLEFHSTLGNIQSSYGIIGSILFLRLIFIALKNNRFHEWYILLALMLYGYSHNGIRNTLFWILLGFIATTTRNKE